MLFWFDSLVGVTFLCRCINSICCLFGVCFAVLLGCGLLVMLFWMFALFGLSLLCVWFLGCWFDYSGVV